MLSTSRRDRSGCERGEEAVPPGVGRPALFCRCPTCKTPTISATWTESAPRCSRRSPPSLWRLASRFRPDSQARARRPRRSAAQTTGPTRRERERRERAPPGLRAAHTLSRSWIPLRIGRGGQPPAELAPAAPRRVPRPARRGQRHDGHDEARAVRLCRLRLPLWLLRVRRGMMSRVSGSAPLVSRLALESMLSPWYHAAYRSCHAGSCNCLCWRPVGLRPF